MIPCKENKCILYPICASKTEITCSELRKYLEKRILEEDYVEDVWLEINSNLKNLLRIRYNKYFSSNPDKIKMEVKI